MAAAVNAGSEILLHRIAGKRILRPLGRELFDARRRLDRDTLEHNLEVGARVDARQPAGRDQALGDPDGIRSDLRPAIGGRSPAAAERFPEIWAIMPRSRVLPKKSRIRDFQCADRHDSLMGGSPSRGELLSRASATPGIFSLNSPSPKLMPMGGLLLQLQTFTESRRAKSPSGENHRNIAETTAEAARPGHPGDWASSSDRRSGQFDSWIHSRFLSRGRRNRINRIQRLDVPNKFVDDVTVLAVRI